MRSITIVLSSIALASCASRGPEPAPVDVDVLGKQVTRVADEYVAAYSAAFPEWAALSGLSLPRHDRLGDNSLAALAAWHRKQDAWLEAMQDIDGEALWGRPEWITYGFLREVLEADIGLRVCRKELWPLNQMLGWQAIPFSSLATAQPVGTPKRRAEALARWRQLPRYLDTEIQNLRQGLREGYTTPRRNVELTLAQLERILQLVPEASPFFGPAARDGDPSFRAAWARMLDEELAPAIRGYRDFVRDEYLPASRSDPALTVLPRGEECYRASFRYYTSLERPPEAIHALGREIVAANEAQARSFGKKWFGSEDLAVLRRRIENDAANHPKSAKEIRDEATALVNRARTALPRWFGRLPQAPLVVEPIPDALAAAASPYYVPAAHDGSRPGTYYIKLHEPTRQLRSRNEILAFHEGYPGHHLQLAVGAEQPGRHPIGTLARVSSFSEGWARYAEALAEEMELYQSPYAPIMRRYWPARGMVVDTGIHVLGWSRRRAVAYMAEGMAPVDPETLADRIAIWPAQLTAYDTGAREFFSLREQAQRELGDRFELRAFHDAVLSHGSVTLPMLRRIVERWIADQKVSPEPSD